MRVAIKGLLLNALVSFVFIILTLIDGEASTAVFFGLSIALSAILAGLMWRFGKWALALIAVWGLLNLSWFITFPDPNSFFDFVLPLLLSAGGLLALVGAVALFVQQRRGTARTTSTRRERWTFTAIAVVLVALVILSGTLHVVGLTSVSAEVEAGAISVEMKNSYLAPDRLEIPLAGTTRIMVKNNDFFVHTFEIEELGVRHTILPFSELLIELRPENSGEFTYRSKARMTGDMEATLVVTQ